MRERDKNSDREKTNTPTAGPSQDDRFGAGHVATNLETRVIGVSTNGDRTRVTIARGKTSGVHLGMEGYLKAGRTILSQFQIDEVHDARCLAYVDVIPDQLKLEQTVVINPTSMPRDQQAAATPTRVIGVWIEAGRTKIIIPRGTAQGVVSGRRGQLRGADGKDGPSFMIEYSTETQAFAFVVGTVDEVKRYPNVILQGASRDRGPIQRRARGTASAGDVQQTANAGVASASSMLPHFDAIQRSFGKHDISGIRAEVGGAASSAASALGAQAYATGDRVAFASAPDVHTAAHEAAHVIQQRRGAVGFQGLGAADDEHERHADTVADAVVAGRSAEPLLDQLSSGGSSTGSIQARRAGDRAPKFAPLDQMRIDVSRLGLRNAQHAMEKWHTASNPNKLISDTRTHLAEVIAAIGGLTLERAQIEALQPQMEETTRAIFKVVLMHGDRPPMTQLVEQAAQVCIQLRLEPAALNNAFFATSGPSSLQPGHKNADIIGPVIDLVRAEAESANERLVDIDVRKAPDKEAASRPDERAAVITAISAKLQHHISYAHAMLSEHPQLVGTVKAKIAAASAPIQQIRAWIFARQDNANLLPVFDRVLHDIDALRATAGFGSLAREPVPPLARVSGEGAQKEKDAVERAQKLLATVIDTQFIAFTTGANKFKTYATLAPPPPKTSFWEELAKGVLISVIGNVIGPAVGALVKANAHAMTEASLGLLANSTTDTVQGLASKIADGAFKNAASENDKVRNVQVFYQGLVLTQAACASAAKDKIAERIKDRSVSAAELEAMRADLAKADLQHVAETTFHHAAHGFTLLTAQLRLGVQDRGGKNVSAMDGYFGVPGGGPRFGETTVGSKLGTTGVGRLRVSVFDDGNIAGYQVEKFALHGMVGDMAKAILGHADYRVAKLGLPLEVEVEPPASSGRDGTAFIAIDERGDLRATKGWRNLQGTWSRARNAGFYATPEALWRSLRNDRLPTDIVGKE